MLRCTARSRTSVFLDRGTLILERQPSHLINHNFLTTIQWASYFILRFTGRTMHMIQAMNGMNLSQAAKKIAVNVALSLLCALVLLLGSPAIGIGMPSESAEDATPSTRLDFGVEE